MVIRIRVHFVYKSCTFIDFSDNPYGFEVEADRQFDDDIAAQNFYGHHMDQFHDNNIYGNESQSDYGNQLSDKGYSEFGMEPEHGFDAFSTQSKQQMYSSESDQGYDIQSDLSYNDQSESMYNTQADCGYNVKSDNRFNDQFDSGHVSQSGYRYDVQSGKTYTGQSESGRKPQTDISNTVFNVQPAAPLVNASFNVQQGQSVGNNYRDQVQSESVDKYERYGRPDQLVFNTITTAVEPTRFQSAPIVSTTSTKDETTVSADEYLQRLILEEKSLQLTQQRKQDTKNIYPVCPPPVLDNIDLARRSRPLWIEPV